MDRDLARALLAITDVGRVRICAALADGPATVPELATALGMPRPAAARHFRLLTDAGLLAVRGEGGDAAYTLRPERVADLARQLSALAADGHEAVAEGVDVLPADEAKVVRSFVEQGRLRSIPAHDSKRQVILGWLLERCFPEDRIYPEKEVNQRLALYHPDVASLRRYLVDTGLMTREAGRYRRSVRASAGPHGPG
jgi:DNA-binding transcriptional ArsR family regulator